MTDEQTSEVTEAKKEEEVTFESVTKDLPADVLLVATKGKAQWDAMIAAQTAINAAKGNQATILQRATHEVLGNNLDDDEQKYIVTSIRNDVKNMTTWADLANFIDGASKYADVQFKNARDNVIKSRGGNVNLDALQKEYDARKTEVESVHTVATFITDLAPVLQFLPVIDRRTSDAKSPGSTKGVKTSSVQYGRTRKNGTDWTMSNPQNLSRHAFYESSKYTGDDTLNADQWRDVIKKHNPDWKGDGHPYSVPLPEGAVTWCKNIPKD